MGFEQLETAIVSPQVDFKPEDVAFEDEKLQDALALALVLQDVSSAESFLTRQGITHDMKMADALYRANVKERPWPGTDQKRANMSMPVVLEAIDRLMPALFLPLFAKNPPFLLNPKGRTTPAAARAHQHLLAWAIDKADFKEQMRLTLMNALQYGFCIGTWGWKTKTEKFKRRQIQADGKVKRWIEKREISIPTYECMDLTRVLIDPACSSPDVRRGAGFVAKQVYISANELDEMRDDPTYKNVPTREELRRILAAKAEPTTDSLSGLKSETGSYQAERPDVATSLDPLAQPLELLEYVTEDRVITVLQRKIIIRNEPNEFDKLNFVSCAFIDVLGSAYGYGVAKLAGGEQQFQVAAVNAWVDNLAMVMNPAFQTLKGLVPGSQNIKLAPGKVITESAELKPLTTPSVTNEAIIAIGNSKQRANDVVGANGGTAAPSPAFRTAEGIQSFNGDVVQRLQYHLENFISLVFIPVLEAFLELCMDKLEPDQINEILTDADGQAYIGDITDVYTASCNVDVLAGTKLTNRVAALEMVPQLITLLSAQPFQNSLVVQNKKFNYLELLEEYIEAMGVDVNSLIQEMTPEEAKRAMTMNPAIVKGQQDQALEAQKHQNDLEKIQEKGTTQAGVAMVKMMMKGNAESAAAAMQGEQTNGR